MSLLFNTLSMFAIAFLPRSKCLFISWLPSQSAVLDVLEFSQSNKICPLYISHSSSSIYFIAILLHKYGEKVDTVTNFIFLGSQITADGDCSHEMKRHLLLRRKAVTNLDSILKSRDITLPTKVRLVKAMVFPVVMYGYESWTIKKAEHRRIDSFELWYWRRLLRVPWTARRSNQSILKEISPNSSTLAT